ncbi:MAG: hypothetical protein KC713_00830 [Candidatus Omnitrophica bacterium]|nr:hypothetical protein [Candidatus Omnitrophota bacterium]
MSRKIMSMFLGLVLVFCMTAAGFAEDVFVTKFGKKYHHVDSGIAKNRDGETITLEEAQKRGLKPSKDYLRRQEVPENEIKK